MGTLIHQDDDAHQTMTVTCISTATPTAVVESLTPRMVSQMAPTVKTRVSGPQTRCHDV